MRRASEETRQRLLDEGVLLFVRQGYHGTGIKDVLDRVGVPKGSFYNYFESKEQFGAEVVRHYADNQGGRLAAALADPQADAHAALVRFYRDEICRFVNCREGCLLGNLAGELGSAPDLCRDALAAAMAQAESLIGEAIARAQEQGTVRGDLSASLLAGFLFNAWEGALMRMQVDGGAEPLEACVKLVLEDLFRPRGQG